jgi:hypothetical protein
VTGDPRAPEPRTPADKLLQLLGGKCRVQAVSTVAALGIADRLAAGPRSIASLADELGCDPGVLTSLLRLVAGLGFFSSPEPGVYALAEDGRALCADQLGPLAAFLGAPDQWDPWARLRDAARGGEIAFVRTHGVGLYEYLAREPAAAARYDAAIDAFTRHEAAALCGGFAFAGIAHIVDVGGGRGTLLAEILQRHPHLRGTLFDLPHVVDRALPALAARFGDRVAAHGGDFFVAVPNGADAYLVKHVLHNWDDERALAVLKNCAAAMAPGGTVLVIETVLSPDDRADLAAMLDLEMMVVLGGRERRKPELRRLFAAAGLSLAAMQPLVSGSWLLVGNAVATR